MTIPPDLAAVLGNAPIHPALLLTPVRRVPPTAATLSSAALALASYASYAAGSLADGAGGTGGVGALGGVSGVSKAGDAEGSPYQHEWLPEGVSGFVHTVGSGGVLHLGPSSRPRALSLAHGVLSQRCTSRPRLQPGAVRLLPPGHAVTLADLDGNGALAVEVVF
jgi:hypothetical protein